MRLSTLGLVALLSSAPLGCGPKTTANDAQYSRSVRPGTVEPKDAVERAILKALADLPAGKASQVEGRKVVAGEQYAAASGQMCRTVSIADGPDRLACERHHRWVFVPNVFGAQASGT